MGISLWQVLIVLAIVLLLFGTKKLRNAGGDIGAAIKGFKKGMQEDEPSLAIQNNTSADGLSENERQQSNQALKQDTLQNEAIPNK